ncbi:MAG: hypothetical protein WCC41_18015, partial [Rhodomicrobium sp.]
GKRRLCTAHAVNRHRAYFGECPLLEVEPPFMPDACPSLEASLSAFPNLLFWLAAWGQRTNPLAGEFAAALAAA